MKEFMFRVLNQKDHQTTWSPETHQQFLKSCERYIGELQKNGNLISAQPLVREGKTLSRFNGEWAEKPIELKGDVQVGYYHILASDMEDALRIAKQNPEFEFSQTARIEVQPVKTKESKTGFVYPVERKDV